MNWYPQLYLGEKAAKKKEALIQKIESGKTPPDTYLLTLASGPSNQLEIVPAWNLRFWYSRGSIPMVVGLGCGRREAFALVQKITEDVYRQTGGVMIRAYLEQEAQRADSGGNSGGAL